MRSLGTSMPSKSRSPDATVRIHDVIAARVSDSVAAAGTSTAPVVLKPEAGCLRPFQWFGDRVSRAYQYRLSPLPQGPQAS